MAVLVQSLFLTLTACCGPSWSLTALDAQDPCEVCSCCCSCFIGRTPRPGDRLPARQTPVCLVVNPALPPAPAALHSSSVPAPGLCLNPCFSQYSGPVQRPDSGGLQSSTGGTSTPLPRNSLRFLAASLTQDRSLSLCARLLGPFPRPPPVQPLGCLFYGAAFGLEDRKALF